MTTAFVLINSKLGKEGDIIEDLKHIDSVKEVRGTFGAYDIIAKVENDKKDDLRDVITWGIRKMDNVRSTLTLMEVTEQN
ncbi:MAG: Lrp/AsnC ligand binding domain-containing protein [Nitrosarchaeum sp.]|nr:Lrp/AsnC ligand binding domain-containing protein [Nitrosarchaeum sp.]MCV0399817.1 Lrp/AsnC ligand binding domain-containing protein [Nitrosarchaeum sp.]